MSRKGSSIMRSIRLQLKTGFMKEEPEEFLFMKRYPPIQRDSQVKFHSVEAKKIPYLDLLAKAAERNPLYGDRVYPAYWQDEPVGLTLAKKQYQCMMNGDSEDAAFRKAELYIDELESKSYVELKNINKVLADAGAKAPFLNDETLMKEILQWQELLKHVPYHTLSLADQGDVDHLLQTRVLKWSEGERERRMKDPMFVVEFEQLRDAIFPNPREAEKNAKQAAVDAKRNFCNAYKTNYDLARASFPFYADDYVKWFARLKAEPDTSKWRLEERSTFSNWIIDTLALQSEMQETSGKDARAVQRYLNTLKYQFFPMTRPGVTTETETFATPSVDSLRRVLFENEIGYKQQNNKVFVKRFYRIPALLFPLDTLLASIISEKDYAEGIVEVNDEELLLNEIRSVGLDDANLPKVMAQLRAYVDKVKLDMPNYNNGSDDKSADANIDAVLGGIINSALGERTAASGLKKDSTPVPSSLFSDSDNEGASSSSGSSSDSDSSDEESEYPKHKQLHKQLRKIQDNDDRNEFILKAIEWMDEDEKAAFFEPLDDGEDSDVDEDEMTPMERSDRAALIDKYVKPPTTELERDRRQLLDEFDPLPLSKAHDETDLYMVQQYRLEQEVKGRARAEFIYSEKETARRAREWRKRRLWKMPRPSLPIVGLNEV